MKKKHHMSGVRNASKGREHWERINVSIDPALKSWARKKGVNITNVLNQALIDRRSNPPT